MPGFPAMLKSYEKSLLSVVGGIFRDASAAYPALSDDFGKDLSRLRTNIESRGLTVLTIELPSLCKHLDRCLDNALWIEPRMTLSRRSGPRSTGPRFLGKLWNRVFDNKGMLRDEVDITALAFIRQILLCAKKVRLECTTARRDAAIAEFYDIESNVPPPSLDWNGDGFSGVGARDLSLVSFDGYHPVPGELNLLQCDGPPRRSLMQAIQQTADILAVKLGVFDPLSFTPKHGPGVVSDLKGGQFKYDFPSWSDRLERVFPYADFAFANYDIWVDGVPNGASSIEASSRLICVPKTQKGPRLICAEPAAHQWCQQVIWDYFRQRYSQTFLGAFVSFGDQTKNQDLACRASLENSHWTVDLSSASDRLSCRLVERIFRRNPSLLDALYSSRTRFVSQDLLEGMPSIVRLNKFSTMGSACTFPVQSHVFLAITIGSTLYGLGHAVSERTIADLIGEVRVFGDDLIIPKAGGRFALEALGYLGLKVNQEKTYRNGRFRESCGLEAFDGVDITPSYFLRPPTTTNPESTISAIACSNNFFLKGYWHAADEIARIVPRKYTIPVVGYSSGSMGYTSFCGVDVTHLRRRWSKTLHREEFLVSQLQSNCDKRDVSHWGQLLQYFTERPEPDLVWKSGAVGRPRLQIKRGWVEARTLGDTYSQASERW